MSTGAALVVLLLALLTVSVEAADFEVTSVIEIGPVHLSSTEGSIKFSPSGDRVAYFVGTQLRTADTLGQVEEITTFEMKPIRFEWLSDLEIIIMLYKHLGGPNDMRHLVVYDLHADQTRLLHEWFRDNDPGTPDTPAIRGPRTSVTGNVFYQLEYGTAVETRIPNSRYSSGKKQVASARDEYLEWRANDGLYRKAIDGTQAVRIGPDISVSTSFPPVADPDLHYVMAGSKIYDVLKDTIYNIESLFTNPEAWPSCEFYWAEFNPVRDELVFDRYCWKYGQNHTELEMDWIGLFDINTKEITVLDDLVGLDNCQSPAFSPDGRRIAFISEGFGYIITREWE